MCDDLNLSRAVTLNDGITREETRKEEVVTKLKVGGISQNPFQDNRSPDRDMNQGHREKEALKQCVT